MPLLPSRCRYFDIDIDMDIDIILFRCNRPFGLRAHTYTNTKSDGRQHSEKLYKNKTLIEMFLE